MFYDETVYDGDAAEEACHLLATDRDVIQQAEIR